MNICIPIRVKNLVDLKKQVKKAKKYANFVEIWLDSLKNVDFSTVFKCCSKPVIAVCKDEEERGGFRGTEEERIFILKKAVETGAKFVDIGINTNIKYIRDLKKTCRKHKAKMIISEHFWYKTPTLSVLESRVKKAQKMGADIVKIATDVISWGDNVILFELTWKTVKKGCKIIVIGMGEKGRISRIGCPLLGSYIIYVALDEKSKTASGQLTVSELKEYM